MKKRDIINLLNLRATYINTTTLSNLGTHFPLNVLELKNEIDILKKEQELAVELHKQSEQEIKKLECTHEVRLTYSCIFGCNSECVLCGKRINGDNFLNGTIYNDVNRNRYYVSFQGDYNDVDEGFIPGVEESIIHKYILEISKRYNDEDDIDLVQEFKELNLEDCKIYERPFKKENYILIIGGSNKQYISNDSYISSLRTDLSIELSHYFLGISKTNVELIDSPENISSKKFQENFPYQSSNFKYISYEDSDELLKEIESLSGFCPFDLIINLANLNTYVISNGNIFKDEIDLKLKELFPNSFIINMKQIDNLSDREVLEKFKQLILEYNLIVGYKNNISNNKTFYTLEENKENIVDGIQISSLCDNIKKLVFKK